MAAIKVIKVQNDKKTGISRLRLELVLAPDEFIDSDKVFKMLLKKVKKQKK